MQTNGRMGVPQARELLFQPLLRALILPKGNSAKTWPLYYIG